MIGSIGTMELVVILVIALMVFGPRKLPELGRSIGKSLGEFKRASNDLRHTLEDEIHVEEQARREAARPAAPANRPPTPNTLGQEIDPEEPAPPVGAPAQTSTDAANDPHDPHRGQPAAV